MAIEHARPGEPVSIRPLGSALAGERTKTLIKTAALEVIRLVIPAGKHIPSHHVPREITVQCLEGKVAFTAGEKTVDLEAGQLLYLQGSEPHALQAIEDASVLVTILK
jgi:quercetin dioxygenase-like cupin family protein